MIEITDSRTIRASSSPQTLLNDLVDKYDWYNVTYRENGTDVDQLQLSENVYLTVEDGKLKYYHTRSNVNGELNSDVNWGYYEIVKTDNAVMAINGSSLSQTGYRAAFAVCPSTNLETGVVRNGLAITWGDQRGVLTEGSLSYTMYAASLMVSNYSTQLIRIFSPTCKDVFSDDVMLPYLTKPYASRPIGKVVFNEDNTKKYFIYNNLAVKYTD